MLFIKQKLNGKQLLTYLNNPKINYAPKEYVVIFVIVLLFF